ncbi:tetratricopeptide repeat protein [uncultured Methanobrevibacter sp.]|uniref:tetratricopeptide repeat protein n=1 Tax=uncultured Methanobrevibacter sp. TaxID=253161 RepID=UPI00258B1AA6|nr:hypothetical protein [uncultured Methanobrevibacter sp.]
MVVLKEDFNKANDLLTEGKLDESLKIFQDLYNKDYEKTDVLYNMINIYLQKQDFRNAGKHCDLYLQINPDDLQILSIKCSCLINIKKYNDGLDLTDKMLDLDPTNVQAYLMKLSIYESLNQVDEGTQLIENLKNNDKDTFSQLETICNAMFNEEDNPINHFSNNDLKLSNNEVNSFLYDLIRYDDENDEIKSILNMVSSDITNNNLDMGLSALDEILYKYPNNIPSLLFKSAILVNLNNYDDALENVNKVLALTKTDPSVWGMRGIVQLDLKNYNNAQRSFKKAIDLDDSIVEFWRYYAYSMIYSNKFDKVLEINEKALKLFPDNEDLKEDHEKILDELEKIDMDSFNKENMVFM